MEDSRISFQKHYSTPTGTAKTYTPSDYVRADRIDSVDYTRYHNYQIALAYFTETRRPFTITIIGLLFSTPIDFVGRERDRPASWVYNHRDSIDDARYEDLLAHDAGLAVRCSWTQQRAAGPNYVLPTMVNDPDLCIPKGSSSPRGSKGLPCFR